jgi:large repetitive protein
LAVVDDSRTTPVNTAFTVPSPGVLANDTGTGITVKSNTDPSHGTVTVNADGGYTYTPDTDYSGPDSYTYTIVDNLGATLTATVNLTVTPVAVDDSVTTRHNTPVTINVVANDHGSALKVTDVTQPPPAEGKVRIVGGKPVYTPRIGFSGTATFTYTVTDSAGQTSTATVTVTVPPAPGAARAKNDTRHGHTGQPVTLHPLNNDTPSNGATWQAGTLRLIDPGSGLRVTRLVVSGEGTWTLGADGAVTFTPANGFTGDPTPVAYSVRDSNNHLVTATITIDYPTVNSGGGIPNPPGQQGGGTTPTAGDLPRTGATDLAGTIWLGFGGILLGVVFLALSAGGRRRRRPWLG